MNIVITGGSKGMGKAMAEKFAAAENNIFICSRNKKELAETDQKIERKIQLSNRIFFSRSFKKNGSIGFCQLAFGKKNNN